jgi:hypothetical protein
MGTLGRHKRRRRNPRHAHGCNNPTGRGVTKTLAEDSQTPSEPEPTAHTTTNNSNPPKKLLVASITHPPSCTTTKHEKEVVVKFTAEELAAFLSFLRQEKPMNSNSESGAQKVSEHDHSCLLDKISRIEILEFEEDEDDIMDDSGGKESMDVKGEESMDNDTS